MQGQSKGPGGRHVIKSARDLENLPGKVLNGRMRAVIKKRINDPGTDATAFLVTPKWMLRDEDGDNDLVEFTPVESFSTLFEVDLVEDYSDDAWRVIQFKDSDRWARKDADAQAFVSKDWTVLVEPGESPDLDTGQQTLGALLCE